VQPKDPPHRAPTRAELHALTQKVCGLPRAERWGFIRELLEVDLFTGLTLAERCLTSRSRFEELARLSLSADASTIRYWVGAVVRGVGIESALDIYAGLTAESATGVEKAAYWLGMYEHAKTQSILAAIRSLKG